MTKEELKQELEKQVSYKLEVQKREKELLKKYKKLKNDYEKSLLMLNTYRKKLGSYERHRDNAHFIESCKNLNKTTKEFLNHHDTRHI